MNRTATKPAASQPDELPALFARAYHDTPYWDRGAACERMATMALRAAAGKRTEAEMLAMLERIACNLGLDIRELV